jgi:hypothetical protein
MTTLVKWNSLERHINSRLRLFLTYTKYIVIIYQDYVGKRVKIKLLEYSRLNYLTSLEITLLYKVNFSSPKPLPIKFIKL